MISYDPAREARIRHLMDNLRNETTDRAEDITRVHAHEFSDPETAAMERDLVFGRVPSIVAHSSEVAEPGDFLTLRMPRNNVIIVRQKDGSVKAFVNQCRHRGNLLEDKPSGTCRLFSCGYHRWSYDTDGSLRTITRESTVGEFDHSEFGLIELPTEERHGFIWMIDRAGVEIDVAAWLGEETDASLAAYDMEKLVTFRAEGYDEPVNWKVMQDAFIDGYHIQYAHPNSAGKVIHTNTFTFEELGRHARWMAPRKAIDRWLNEDPGDQSLVRYVNEAHLLMPNSVLLCLTGGDHYELLTFRPHPTDPGRCRMEMRIMVEPQESSGFDADEWNRRWERNWEILLEVLHSEDFPLLRGTQTAMYSADAGEMLYGRNETVNQVFQRELRHIIETEKTRTPSE